MEKEYIWLLAGALLLAVGALIYILRGQRHIGSRPESSAEGGQAEPKPLVPRVEELPDPSLLDESRLVKITDKTLLARITDLIPELTDTVLPLANAVATVKNSKDLLYRAVLPAPQGSSDRGKALSAAGAAGTVADAASSVAGVASMIVGQYYMSQIDTEISALRSSLSGIAGFLNNEYKSKVMNLSAQVQQSASLRAGVLEKDELRLAELEKLRRLEEQCSQLLFQAGLNLEELLTPELLKFEEYQRITDKAQFWRQYQQVLLELLCRIEGLIHALRLGDFSREQSFQLLPVHTGEVRRTRELLARWHERQCRNLKIDLRENHRRRLGLDRLVHLPVSLLRKESRYIALPGETALRIRSQTKEDTDELLLLPDLFRSDVQLIEKDGELYYLPGEGSLPPRQT